MSRLRELGRQLVFFAGDIRRLDAFPYVTWAQHRHQIDYDELFEVLPLIQYGDVGLHRDNGYLSNLSIPGFMKHAWLHVEDGVEHPTIVEAVSEGVIERSALYPLFSDYAMILSPKGATDAQRRGACAKMRKIVGAEYDTDFQFNIEEELKFYEGTDTGNARTHLIQAERYLQRYNYAFSCTEAVAYAWWHLREKLKLRRTGPRGKEGIKADDFINRGWDIKWLSRSVSVDAARKGGLGVEGLSMIEEYWSRSGKRSAEASVPDSGERRAAG